jgi:hypothetical protein
MRRSAFQCLHQAPVYRPVGLRLHQSGGTVRPYLLASNIQRIVHPTGLPLLVATIFPSSPRPKPQRILPRTLHTRSQTFHPGRSAALLVSWVAQATPSSLQGAGHLGTCSAVPRRMSRQNRVHRRSSPIRSSSMLTVTCTAPDNLLHVSACIPMLRGILFACSHDRMPCICTGDVRSVRW